jgi:AbrB family looped-hinge helix DNA binding protein
MVIARSKITIQGQVSIPAEVRRRLNASPGSTLEWDQEGEAIVVRRAGRFTSEEMHRALFSVPPRENKLLELKEGIRKNVRGRRAVR